MGVFLHLCNQDDLTLTVMVDSNDDVTETDEGNNWASVAGLTIAGNEDEDDDICGGRLCILDFYQIYVCW